MVRVVLYVPRENGSKSGKVTLKIQLQGSHEGGFRGKMDRLEPHNYREPFVRNLNTDGEDIAGTILLGTLTNMKKGLQDGNESVFVDGN